MTKIHPCVFDQIWVPWE